MYYRDPRRCAKEPNRSSNRDMGGHLSTSRFDMYVVNMGSAPNSVRSLANVLDWLGIPPLILLVLAWGANLVIQD